MEKSQNEDIDSSKFRYKVNDVIILSCSPFEEVTLNSYVCKLEDLYKSTKLSTVYDRSKLTYLFKLSCRYAMWTSPTYIHNHDIILSHSTWLSLVWIVDGICDKYGTKFPSDHPIKLIEMFECMNKMEKIDHLLRPEGNPIYDVLLDVTSVVYPIYLRLIEPFRKDNEDTFKIIWHWFHKYILTTGNGTSRKKLPIDNVTLEEYRRWRIDSGAIMCVLYHNILYKNKMEGISPRSHMRESSTGSDVPCLCDDSQPTAIASGNQDWLTADTPRYFAQDKEKAYRDVAAIVSYHNDLLSYDRDKIDGTPNLVTVIWKSGSLTEIEAFKKGISVVNDMYDGLDISLDKVSKSVLVGSFNWTNLEDRYISGIKLVQLATSGQDDEWYKTLGSTRTFSGDPA